MWRPGILVAVCAAGASWLLLPHLLRAVHSQAWSFSDRMRWHGVRVSPTRVLHWMGGGAVVVGLMGWLIFANLLLAVLGMVLVCLAPGWIVAAVQSHHRKKFGAQFVDVLLLLSNSLRAGFNLNQALQIVATEMPSPAKNEFSLVLMDRELGASMERALENLGQRMKSDSVRIFITAILVTLQTGGDIVHMLDKLVNTIRDRERVEDRVRTMTASGRMQGYVVAVLPIFLFMSVYLWKGEVVRPLLESLWGQVVIVLGVLFNVMGLVAIRKMSTVDV